MNHMLPRICWAVAGKVGRNGHWSFPNRRGIGHPRPWKLGWEGFSTDGLLTSVTKPSYQYKSWMVAWEHVLNISAFSAQEFLFRSKLVNHQSICKSTINVVKQQDWHASRGSQAPLLVEVAKEGWGLSSGIQVVMREPLPAFRGRAKMLPRVIWRLAVGGLNLRWPVFLWGFAKWLFCFFIKHKTYHIPISSCTSAQSQHPG